MSRLGEDRRPSRAESGMTSVEFLGIALVVGVVVAAIAFTIGGPRTTDRMTSAYCSIAGGRGCDGGSGGSGGTGGSDGPVGPGGPAAARCVGAPGGAAGPVRGSVAATRADGDDGSPLTVSVMGDGTYRVTATPDPDVAATWVGRAFGDAAAGAEPHLLGGGSEVWSASSPSGLAALLAADRTQSWNDTVLGTGDGVVTQVADAALGLVAGRDGLPAPTARYTDTSAAAGLSLNAYDQTVALDAGGEAVGTLDYADGSSTQYVGVSERTSVVPVATDLVPMLLETDLDPAGNVTAVRTVTDRDFTPTGPSTPSGSLYVTHLDLDGGGEAPVLSALASSVGATTLGVDPASTLEGPVPLARSSSALKSAATASGYVTRQQPQGTVAVDDPNADPVAAGLAQVMRSSAPEVWDGTAWTTRSPGCAS